MPDHVVKSNFYICYLSIVLRDACTHKMFTDVSEFKYVGKNLKSSLHIDLVNVVNQFWLEIAFRRDYCGLKCAT